jgi:hypothetical protein
MRKKLFAVEIKPAIVAAENAEKAYDAICALDRLDFLAMDPAEMCVTELTCSNVHEHDVELNLCTIDAETILQASNDNLDSGFVDIYGRTVEEILDGIEQEAEEEESCKEAIEKLMRKVEELEAAIAIKKKK